MARARLLSRWYHDAPVPSAVETTALSCCAIRHQAASLWAIRAWGWSDAVGATGRNCRRTARPAFGSSAQPLGGVAFPGFFGLRRLTGGKASTSLAIVPSW